MLTDCEVGPIKIRPEQTWVNPSNRCERIFCSSKVCKLLLYTGHIKLLVQGSTLVAVTTDVSKRCPVLDCPANRTIQPMGKCCPICLCKIFCMLSFLALVYDVLVFYYCNTVDILTYLLDTYGHTYVYIQLYSVSVLYSSRSA